MFYGSPHSRWLQSIGGDVLEAIPPKDIMPSLELPPEFEW
jgi:hypothetical protein